MKSKLLHDEKGLRTSAIVFDKNDEVGKGLLEFANTNRFADAHLTGIGAFSGVTLGFLIPAKSSTKNIPINEQVEVLSFIENIVQKDGRPRLRAHVLEPTIRLTVATFSADKCGRRWRSRSPNCRYICDGGTMPKLAWR